MGRFTRLVNPCQSTDWYLIFLAQSEEQSAREVISRNVAAFPHAPLRLFILGVGNTVSSSVCETLAKAGGGEFLLALSQESILPKCTGLLRAGRTSTITDVSVDWMAEILPGHGPSYQPLIQQSPPESSIPEVYPFSRSLYFAIIPTNTIPKQVVIRGKANGKDVFIHVDVESMKFGRKISEPPFIHTLAAHRLIQDLEWGNAKGKRPETVLREEIIKLGEYYQLASSHTSFVAVDHGEVDLRPQKRASPTPFMRVASLLGTVWQYLANPTTLFRSHAASLRSPSKQGRYNGLPGGWSTSDSAGSEISSSTEYSEGSEDYDDWASQHSADTFSTLSSLESYSTVETTPRPQRPHRSSSQHQRDHAPSPQVPYAPLPPVSTMTGGAKEEFKPPQIPPGAETLVQQMSASGSFTLTDALGAIVGRDVLEEARSWNDDELAATALAMVYLVEKLGNHLDVYQVLLEKMMEFIGGHPNGGRFDELLDRARAISQPEAA